MPALTEPTLAWLAGVVDAFGIVRVRLHGDTPLPGLFLHSPNLQLLERVAGLTGTKVTTVRRAYSKAGCAIHCEDKHQHVRSTSGRWSVTGAKATVVLEAIRPYLQLQAAEADEVLAVGRSAPRKPATLRKMRDLGWPVDSGQLMQ